MNPDNEAQLVVELRRDEGVRYVPYADTKGIPTTGVGHNLQASPLPPRWTYPLTDDQVNQLLMSDLSNVYSDLSRALPWWTDLNDVRQRAICNMCFQLGINKLVGFKNSLAFLRQGKYEQAADNMMLSAWADQTPNRAKRVTQQIRLGS